MAVIAGQVIPAYLAANLTFDPSGTYTGNAIFTYSSTDNDGNTDASPATFTIPITNTAPVANDITINNIKVNTTVKLPSLSGSDADGTIASYTISTLPTLGTLQVDLTGSGTYTAVTAGQVLTPAQAARLRILSGAVQGTSVFTYTTTDNLGAIDATPANYTIPISSATSVNQPPSVYDIINPAINANAGQTAINPLQGTDPDGTIADYTILNIPPPSYGILYYNNGTSFVPITQGGFLLTPAQMATLRFDPSGNYIGNVKFTYTAHDNSSNIAMSPANYTIPIINTAPVANNITNAGMGSNAGPTTINSLTASDADGTVAFYTITTLPQASQGILYLDGIPVTQGQSLTPAQAARLLFDPNPGFTGNATFTYSTVDNLGAVDQTPATFTIPVTNQPPVADDKLSQVITNQNGTGQLPIPALTGSDKDGTIASFTVSAIPPAAQGVLYYFNGTIYVPVTAGLVLTPAQAQTLQFDPADGFAGTATFTYTTTDNSGNVDATPATYQIPVNTPPITNNITAPAMYASQVNTALPPLVGSDNGFVSFYSITKLPPASQGSLYLNGVLVTNLSQVDTLSALQITQLSFTPTAAFTGTTFSYTATDNQGIIDVTPAVYTIPSKITVSGKVWNDANGGLTQDGAEAVVNGTNSGAGVTTGAVLYVNLIDANGIVLASVPVQIDGTYSFPTVQTNANVTAQLSLNAGTPGLAKPATALPAGWVTTGENKNGEGGLPDGLANGEIIINTNNSIIAQQNFGIERLPNSDNLSTNIPQPTLNQFITLNGGANPPALSGSDAEDCAGSCGTLTNRTVIIDAVPANSELYYNGVLVTNGQQINNFSPALMQVKITAATLGSTSTSFQYSMVDGAGKKDPTPATYTLSWLSPLPLSLIYFTGERHGDNIIVNWKSENEINVNRFEVEYSTDGRNFANGGSEPAKNQPVNYYRYTLINYTQPLYYIRLKSIDADGRVKYSAVVIIKANGGSGKAMVVTPNPVTDKISLRITSDVSATGNIRIINAVGQILYQIKQQLVKGGNVIYIAPPANAVPGTYMVQAFINDEMLVQKIIISK